MLQGYFETMLKGVKRLDDSDLVRFIRAYQRSALIKGRAQAIKDIKNERSAFFQV